MTGDTIQSIGPTPEEISIISEQEPLTGGLGNPIGLSQQLISDKMFYVSARKSNDGRITVQTALPFSGALSDSLRNEPSFWVIIALIALAFTAIAYFSTKFLSRSVRLLKTFADNIENNEGSLGNLPDFPTMSSATYRGASSTCIARKPMPTSGQTASTLWPSTPSRSEPESNAELTNNLNHELKTPIGVIRGYLDTIVASPEMDAATKDRFIHRAYDNVERLCSMLDDISTITRPGGRIKQHKHDRCRLPRTRVQH